METRYKRISVGQVYEYYESVNRNILECLEFVGYECPDEVDSFFNGTHELYKRHDDEV